MPILNRRKRAYRDAKIASEKYNINYEDDNKNTFSVYLKGDPLEKDLPTSEFTGVDEGVIRPELTNSRLRTYYFEQEELKRKKALVRQKAVDLALLQAGTSSRQAAIDANTDVNAKNKKKKKGKSPGTRNPSTGTGDPIIPGSSDDVQEIKGITPLDYINNPEKYSHLNPDGMYVGEDGFMHMGPPSWDSQFWNIMNTDPKIHKQRYEEGLDPLYFKSPMAFNPDYDIYNPPKNGELKYNDILPPEETWRVEESFMDNASDMFTMNMWKGYLPDLTDFQEARLHNRAYLVKGNNIYNVFENLSNYSVARKGAWKPIVDDTYGYEGEAKDYSGKSNPLFKKGKSTGETTTEGGDFTMPLMGIGAQFLPGVNIAVDLWGLGMGATKAYKNREEIFDYLKNMNNTLNNKIHGKTY